MSQPVPFTGDEKTSLHVSFDRHRDVVLWKLEGLDDEQLRAPRTPSGTSLPGLVKHLAAVEHSWFCDTFGRETEPLPFDEDDPEADLQVAPGETAADIVAFYSRAWVACNQVIEAAVEDTVESWDLQSVEAVEEVGGPGRAGKCCTPAPWMPPLAGSPAWPSGGTADSGVSCESSRGSNQPLTYLATCSAHVALPMCDRRELLLGYRAGTAIGSRAAPRPYRRAAASSGRPGARPALPLTRRSRRDG